MFSSLRAVLISGDMLRWEDVADWRERFGSDLALFNLYGPTESTVIKLWYPIPVTRAAESINVPVGRPIDDTDILILDENDEAGGPGEIGEVVGKSGSMMTAYHNQPGKTREAEWYDAQGNRFIRTGDVGRFDEDGFLVLMDRRKDMVISGGFNIYPSDLEAVLRQHPAVADAAVVGIASAEWGESPVAYVVPRGDAPGPDALRAWANERLGKTQRLAGVRYIGELPRSDIGKVLKRQLREQWTAGAAAS